MQVAHGRLPRADGWVYFRYVQVTSRRAGENAVFIADAYLTGECERFQSLQ